MLGNAGSILVIAGAVEAVFQGKGVSLVLQGKVVSLGSLLGRTD